MRILFPHPKKVSWSVEHVTWPDGRTAIVVGKPGRDYGTDYRLNHVSMAGARIEKRRNCVLEAAIRVIGNISYSGSPMFVATERDNQMIGLHGDGPAPMHLSVTSMTNILMALGDGRLRLEDGWIAGRFTCAKTSDVYPIAWDGPADAATQYGDAEGAPDLSDLVKTLS